MKVVCRKKHCEWRDEFGTCAIGAKEYNGGIASVCIYGEIVKTNDDNPPPTVKIITKDATTNLIALINLKGDAAPDDATAEVLLNIIGNYCNENNKIIAGEIRNNKIKFHFDKVRFWEI